MSTSTTRQLIAAMQVTLDGRILGPEGEVDWVDSWADGLELLPPVDTFVLGGGMFPDYERFWATVRDDAPAAGRFSAAIRTRASSLTRGSPRKRRISCSTTLTETAWPGVHRSRHRRARALRQQPGKAVYVVGGPVLVASPSTRACSTSFA
jgi:hypothetical protein